MSTRGALGSLRGWTIGQLAAGLAGLILLGFMVFDPPVGVTLFWNMLIPATPALLVVGTGAWRNVCPLATVSMLPDRLGFSRGLKLSPARRGALNLAGLALLLLIVPLRHVVFNTSGHATAALLLGIAALALVMGFLFERRSGWCAGLCPVHPVEKLYGSAVAFSVPNTNCRDCRCCSLPCPDWAAGRHGAALSSSKAARVSEVLMAGAFPGYIWGWFLLPDEWALAGWQSVVVLYGYPSLGALVSATLYVIAREAAGPRRKDLVLRTFAATAVSMYYLFRLPQLFGFNPMHNNGMLIDLTPFLPAWSMGALNVVTTAFFFWWLVPHGRGKRSWSVRPPFAEFEAAAPALDRRP